MGAMSKHNTKRNFTMHIKYDVNALGKLITIQVQSKYIII